MACLSRLLLLTALALCCTSATSARADPSAGLRRLTQQEAPGAAPAPVPAAGQLTAAPPREPGEAGERSGAAHEAREERHSQKEYWVFTHAVLMSVALVGLLPLGALLAQSRWSQPLKKDVGKKNIWFWVHMVINISGVVLVIVAYAICTSDSSHMEIKKDDGSLAYAHKVLGTIVFALLLLQVVVAFIRPHPGQHLRKLWNFAHHNLGRLAILGGWATIWLGVTWWQKDEGVRGGLARWVAPLAVFQGLLLLVYLLNQGIKKRAFWEAKVEDRHQKTLAERNGNGHAVGAPAGSDGSLQSGNGVYGSSIRTNGLQSV